jgi:predicted RNA methylase
MLFVRVGLFLATHALYSLHKTASRAYILKKAKEWGADAEVIATVNYDLAKTYTFHTEASKDIEVDFIRFTPNNTEARIEGKAM